jgi:hypothetical protein
MNIDQLIPDEVVPYTEYLYLRLVERDIDESNCFGKENNNQVITKTALGHVKYDKY